MKLDVAVNEVVLSNVGKTGEFRIRNSAKAFKILSDDLYSNKHRAIIRELSCNAIDSHIAAGKGDVPFEVHLPTQLEPWFAVRDFGLGLDGHQVMNIYTTYFESTKTDSNDFIGALGLGSKSPFSYTENFTVTAVKNGVKRIYSAYINEVGVPSVTEMSEEITAEGNGVEVKFSVVNRGDYYSFRNEASEVFKWFKNKPTITGADGFQHQNIPYKEENVVPGVHILDSSSCGRVSYAVMGNIPYPLNNVPEAKKNLGDIAGLLECGLVLEFGIGELDFAASREQLSYIPLTLANIKKKLELLNANLAKHLAKKADDIKNDWERAEYLYKESRTQLYGAAVKKYVADTKFPLFSDTTYSGRHEFRLFVDDLKTRDLEIKAFRMHSGSSSRHEASTVHHGNGYKSAMSVPVESGVVIVLNDLKTGCVSRARSHFVEIAKVAGTDKNSLVFCISHTNEDVAVRQVEYDKLVKELHNPPVVMKASALEKKVRIKAVSTNGIMALTRRSGAPANRADSYTWTSAGSQPFKTDETYYYVALSNYLPMTVDGETEVPMFQIKAWMAECGIPEITNIKIYGVRQNRLKEIKELDNWIWFEDKLKEEVGKITDDHVASLVAAEMLDQYSNRVYTNKNVAKLVGPDSLYNKYVTRATSVKRISGNVSELVKLCDKYGKTMQVDAVKKSFENAKDLIFKTYPMLKCISDSSDERTVAHYIKLVDKQEKDNE